MARNFPPLTVGLGERVDEIVRAVGTRGTADRRLGFVVGPVAFDDSDDQVRRLMRDSFAVAVERGVAVGFHLDDSMFWDRIPRLNRPENIEWLDWRGDPTTGRRLDWSEVPTRIMPQLCLNSAAVIHEVRRRAALIGEEAVRGMAQLRAIGRPDLFIGLIAGWETQMGRDFDSGRYVGYHALSNRGYSAENPPDDIDKVRVTVVREFVDLWAASLAAAGVPDDRIYSHVAFMSRASFDSAEFSRPGRFPGSYLETVNFTPPGASLGPHHRPGFSTYPQFGLLEQIQAELEGKGSPPWASSEGTAVDPGMAGHGSPGVPMERYLGNLFNRGAVVVNVFGWGVGPASNPFRRIAESGEAVAAYRKFLQGEKMASDPPAQLPSPDFFDKLRRLKERLPPYLAQHGSASVGHDHELLGYDLRNQRYADAEEAVDRILKTMSQ